MGVTGIDHVYLETLGPPCVALLVGVLGLVRPPRLYGAIALLIGAALVALLFALSEDRYCFQAAAENCTPFLTVAIFAWPISISAAVFVLVTLLGSIKQSRQG